MPNTFDGIINEPTVDYLGKDGFFWWFGEVVDNKDPLRLGRCRIRIMGWYTGLDDKFKEKIPNEDLPWAVVLQPTNQPGVEASGESAGQLQNGAMVMGFFLDGQEAQQPVVMGVVRARKQPGVSQGEYNSIFGSDTYDADANLSLRSSATNRVDTGAAAPPNALNTPVNEKQVFSDANTFAHVQFGGSSANPAVPTIAASPAANAVAGSVNTFEGTLTKMLQNIAVAGANVVSTGNNTYVSISSGLPVNMSALTGSVINLVSGVLSEALAAVKELFLQTIAAGLKSLKIAGITGIPGIVTTAIQAILQAVLRVLCGLDSTWLTGTMSVLRQGIDGFVNSVVGSAFDQLSSLIQGAFDDIVNQVLCTISDAISGINSIVSAVSAAVAVTKTVSNVMKTGTAFFQNLEKINIQDLSSITSIISLLLGLIPTMCDRTAPGGDVITSFVPFLGSTDCNIADSNPLGSIAAGCGQAVTTSTTVAAVKSSVNAVQAILEDANEYLTTSSTQLSGYNMIHGGTPGRQSTIERRASGMSWWSIRSNNQEYRNWKEKNDAQEQNKSTGAQNPPDPNKTVFGDVITFPGATKVETQKDFLLETLGEFQQNVGGSYKLKIVGDLDIEVGGRLAFKVNGAPLPVSSTGTSGNTTGKQSKNLIVFDSDTEIAGRGKVSMQGMGSTIASKPGTDVKIMTDTMNLNAPSLNINCTNDLKLCAGNAIYVETPSLVRNINFPPLPRAKSGIFTIMHGSYDMIINPGLGADAVPRYTVNNTAGPISLLVGTGGMFFTVAAGGLTATVTTGAIAMSAIGGALSLNAGQAMTMTAATIMTLTATTIKLN